jgi:hypothetical protein
MSSTRLFLSLALLGLSTGVGDTFKSVEAEGIGGIVHSYCLAAVQQEISQAGRVAPEGMAAYACRCVMDRLSEGTSLNSARSYCRDSTARRYSL